MARVLGIVIVAVSTFVAGAGIAAAQDKAKFGETLKAELKVAQFRFDLEQGKLYRVTASGKGFFPFVTMPGFGGRIQYTQPAPGELHTFAGIVSVTRTGPATFVLAPQIGGPLPEGPLEATFKLEPMPIAEEPMLVKTDRWTADDPRYEPLRPQSHFKAFPLKLKKDRFYVIELERAEGSNIDPYLYLEDTQPANPFSKIVAQDDDGLGNLNSRIIYRAAKDGDFRVVATTLSPGTGEFTLTVRGEPDSSK